MSRPDRVGAKRKWHLHRAQNRHRERAPAGRSRDSARAHCERARNECRQICVPERDKRHGRGDAKAHPGRASPDGRRRWARGSILDAPNSGLGGRLVETFARQLGGQVERESSNKGTIVRLTLPSREASYDLRA